MRYVFMLGPEISGVLEYQQCSKCASFACAVYRQTGRFAVTLMEEWLCEIHAKERLQGLIANRDLLASKEPR